MMPESLVTLTALLQRGLDAQDLALLRQVVELARASEVPINQLSFRPQGMFLFWEYMAGVVDPDLSGRIPLLLGCDALEWSVGHLPDTHLMVRLPGLLTQARRVARGEEERAALQDAVEGLISRRMPHADARAAALVAQLVWLVDEAPDVFSLTGLLQEVEDLAGLTEGIAYDWVFRRFIAYILEEL